jgi:CRISPR-associated protein Cas2
MPVNQQRHHIIAYDIGEPKRLGRIHRYLKNCALPIQYSVFLIRCTPQALQGIIDDLEKMIDPAADDIRFYTLPRKATIMTLGQQGTQPGIQLLGGDDSEYQRKL